jgi:acetyl-CoA carboxylase carboxyl transferase subunit alpha
LKTYLEFEKPLAEIEAKIEELSALATAQGRQEMGVELTRLKQKAAKQLADTYASLDPWQKTQVARHPERPRYKDYVGALITDYTELSGDRKAGEDAAILAGLGRFRGRPVAVMGHEKGGNTNERLKHNFGMARPEGYRKAVRIMDLAERFNLPVITFVDTAGAYPGIGAEERGQAEAIARSTERCLSLGVPMVAVITGEGGSGGAIAIAAANRVLMLEHSIYSVIAPESAATILWRDAGRAKEAATAMRITAQDLLELKVIDDIIPEIIGGAHRAAEETIASVGEAIDRDLDPLLTMTAENLISQRRERFLSIGRMEQGAARAS